MSQKNTEANNHNDDSSNNQTPLLPQDSNTPSPSRRVMNTTIFSFVAGSLTYLADVGGTIINDQLVREDAQRAGGTVADTFFSLLIVTFSTLLIGAFLSTLINRVINICLRDDRYLDTTMRIVCSISFLAAINSLLRIRYDQDLDDYFFDHTCLSADPINAVTCIRLLLYMVPEFLVAVLGAGFANAAGYLWDNWGEDDTIEYSQDDDSSVSLT